MTITIAQQTLWDLFETSPKAIGQGITAVWEQIWHCPADLGCGSVRTVHLRDALRLLIWDCQLRDDLIVNVPEAAQQEWFECGFSLSGRFTDSYHTTGNGDAYLSGGTTLPKRIWHWMAQPRVHLVSVQIRKDLLQQFFPVNCQALPPVLRSLVQQGDCPYQVQVNRVTPTMQTALHQLLHCPYHSLTRRLYLDGKASELVSLLVEQQLSELDGQRHPPIAPADLDCIYRARQILLDRLDDPPVLTELARQVGLNDCTLKRGFRQTFGKTVFGYLHDYRLEQARQLLANRDLKVSQVAQSIGFHDRHHFASVFRKKFGLSPRDYQRLGRSAP